jgi:hypothetical protein
MELTAEPSNARGGAPINSSGCSLLAHAHVCPVLSRALADRQPGDAAYRDFARIPVHHAASCLRTFLSLESCLPGGSVDGAQVVRPAFR